MMSNRKRRAHIKKLKEQTPSVSLKELEDRGEVPQYFHLFTREEMKQYYRKRNQERRKAFKERLAKYDFIDEDEFW